jgi:NADPH2:quinone reductase
MQFPLMIPHHDGAGVIDAVGDRRLSHRIGERVWVYFAARDRPQGTAAQFTVVPARQAVPLAAAQTFDQGASLGIPWITAHRATSRAGALRGRLVVVMGAAGAVGFYAVQIARARGAEVVGVVRTSEGVSRAQRAGAHHVLTSFTDDVGEALRAATGDRRADILIDSSLAHNVNHYSSLLRNGSTAVVYGTGGEAARLPSAWALRAELCLRFVYVFECSMQAIQGAISDLQHWSESLGVRHLPLRRYALEDIADAHDDVALGPSGWHRILRIPQ